MSDIRAQSRRDAEFDRLLNCRDDVDYGYSELAMREAYEMGKRHGREECVDMPMPKLLAVVGAYEHELAMLGVKVHEASMHERHSTHDALGHLRSMVEPITAFVHKGKSGKAYRWLGFMQGVMWVHGRRSLTQMRDENRPDDEVTR